ncbi:adipokinetic hormone/corazonin-related peptide receptor variant I-like [Euwallacea fornicatus]|uniref:adipokinetic hormone/corazonin-related peptide receptor variant I-like n=1 Tax=Euwallacea fornicatus TaxID=995702 RepID=UPI0033905BD9
MSNSSSYNDTFILNFNNFLMNDTVPTINQVPSVRNILLFFVYVVLFLIAAIGNLTVFISLFRSRHRKSRISLMIRHLAIADLIVTFVMIPIEVGWRWTGRFIAGNATCKIVQFMRALGPYLSSNVLVCISLDRYFAVMYPLRVNVARKRGQAMLLGAWGASLMYSLPQCFVFHLAPHPSNPAYQQCVSFGSFRTDLMEMMYNLSSILLLYFIPLFIIIVAYSFILAEISRTSKSHKNSKDVNQTNGKLRLRRSDTKSIERARSRTLRMTVTIVVIFIFCSTPYAMMTLWYMFDRKTAEEVLPEFVQDLCFMMVVSNSCMNPIVYGSFVMDFKKFSCQCTECGEKTSTDSLIPLNSGVIRRSPNMQI